MKWPPKRALINGDQYAHFPTYMAFLVSLSFTVPATAGTSRIYEATGDVQVARYSVVHPNIRADQADLFQALSPISLPENIDSIGGAVQAVLQPSGYRLASQTVLSTEALALLALPLPRSHRKFGPLSLKTVLELLIGPGFSVVVDPVHRLIAFDRCRAAHTNEGE